MPIFILLTQLFICKIDIRYQAIYYANTNIIGITGSAFSESYKNQSIGECEFWRAYCLFYLVNYFGDIPLPLSTDITTNNGLSRTPAADVYSQIVKDLVDAKAKVSASYPSAEKLVLIRPPFPLSSRVYTCIKAIGQ